MVSSSFESVHCCCCNEYKMYGVVDQREAALTNMDQLYPALTLQINVGGSHNNQC